MNTSQTLNDLIGEDKNHLPAFTFCQEISKNETLQKVYPTVLQLAQARLILFLARAYGRPETDSEQGGHPRQRVRHAKWKNDVKIKALWMNAILLAMDQLQLDIKGRETMASYFRKATNHMINHA